MSRPDDTEDRIEDLAADWLARREEGLSAAELREFDRWCRLDPRHAAAVARLEAACALLEKMPLVREELLPVVEFPVESRAPQPAAERPRSFFPSLRFAVGLAAVLALTAVLGWRWSQGTPAKNFYSTTAGGYERVVLSDGSVVELNANTEVRVEFAAEERRVALVSGEAHFSVAHNTARPFIVSVNGVSVRAVGTAFNVRLAASAVEVLVTEGRVAVQPAAAANPPAPPSAGPAASATLPGTTFVGVNERVSISTAVSSTTGPSATPTVVEPVAPEVVHATLSWQERKLVFAETPLRDVVAQFNRRNRVQLVLGDADLGDRPVGGTFAADNVEGFVRLLEGSGTIAVEHRDSTTVVLRRVR